MMSEEEVGKIIEMALGDKGFREKLLADPKAALADYEVTDEEAQSIVAGLAEGFEGELESRISKRRFGAKFGGFSGPMGFDGMTGIK
jgi:hypothetical protein